MVPPVLICEESRVKILIEKLELDTVLLTPNQRLSMQLQRDYDTAQLEKRQKTWRSPCITPIGQYLRTLWEDFTAAGVNPCVDVWLLTDLQELQLWQRVVQQNFDGALLAPESAAREAMQTYRNLALWNLDLQAQAFKNRFQLQDDTAFFYRCAVAFQQLCSVECCIAEADIVAVLATLSPPPCARIVLYGFDEIVPAYTELLKQWNLPFEPVQPGAEAGACQRVSCATERDEFASAATWAEQVLNADSAARIGIIVPELRTKRASIEYEFTRRFEPNYFKPGTARRVLPFNISAGLALANVPLVQCALAVLQLNRNTLPTEQLASLLYSPFLASGQDSLASRIVLENRLRDYQDASLSLGALLFQCNGKGLADDELLCPVLANAVQRFKHLQRGQQKTLDEWLDVFSRQLDALGWPGQRTLDSVEYQQLQRWHEALDDARTLASLTGKLSAADALHMLRQVLRETVFQPQTGGSPIQILGLLEGAGLPFTHLWICGLSSKTWPPAARPSALIPLVLQRELNMPHCGPEREYQFAKRLLHSYMVNSDTIVLSHAQQEDQQMVDPSALIVDVEEVSLAQLLPDESAAQPESASVELETIVTEKAPALHDSEVLRGGVTIYANQAACPFRAFATHRLQARRLATPCTGLSAMQRGILVHHCLDYLWRHLGSQTTLQRKTAEQLQGLIAAAIRDALATVSKNLQPGSVQKLLQLEQARLQTLLTMWLEKEAQRLPFTVKYCEYELETCIAGRAKRLRIDRVDELEDGTQLLLDYKTGQVSATGWRGEPVQDAQLPLYTLCLNAGAEPRVSGIALARVDSHEPKWVGVGSGADVGFPQVGSNRARKDETTWDDYLTQWHAGIDALDFAFSEGEAAVNPLHGKLSCSYCDLNALCRIPNRQLDGNAEEAGDHGA